MPARLVCAALLALLLPLTTFAYTVVLRSGRRVEIPDKFTVTKLTLTYETAPGINITLLMSAIDIRATDRANNEPQGTLLSRAEEEGGANPATTQARQPRRELTQRDIEAGRRQREKSEQDYERRRVELGLPSLEDVRRRTAEETRRLGEQAAQTYIEEVESEAYWRSRSTQLRTEIAALDSQIGYVRARLVEMPENSVIGTYGFVTGVAPGWGRRRPVTRFPIVTGNPGFMRGPHIGAQTTGFLAFGGSTQAHIQLNSGRRSAGFRRRGNVSHGVIFPGVAPLGLPYGGHDYAGERAGLVHRLNELETARAGLHARWRALEEDARRAGAQPGWLRP